MSAEPARRSILPDGLAETELFRRWEADSLKLYLWLRTRARPGPPRGDSGQPLRRGYLAVDVGGAEIEEAIGVSKNTVTKLARSLRDLGVATFQADRAGYHFRLGEWLAWPGDEAGPELRAEAFYLDALLGKAAT